MVTWLEDIDKELVGWCTVNANSISSLVQSSSNTDDNKTVLSSNTDDNKTVLSSDTDGNKTMLSREIDDVITYDSVLVNEFKVIA